MINNSYCDLKPLNTFFNNKPLYKCDYCGLTVGLEIPDTKILCFKKMEDISIIINLAHSNQNTSIKHVNGEQQLSDTILDNIAKDSEQQYIKTQNHNNDANLCSTKQIDERLKICGSCEYFKNNSCLLCGCTVIRDANHKNKLAHKDQKCPADKWGPIG